MRGNSTAAVWALLALALLILVVVIPRVMKHPPPVEEHVFGASERPGHK
jgi:hypothetical protein